MNTRERKSDCLPARESLDPSPWDLPLSCLIVGSAFPFIVEFICFKWLHSTLVLGWFLYPGMLLSKIAFGKQATAPIFFEPANSLIYGAVGLYVGIRLNRRRRNRTNSGRVCIKCGYDLTGLNEPRCPECGTRFSKPVAPSGQG